MSKFVVVEPLEKVVGENIMEALNARVFAIFGIPERFNRVINETIACYQASQSWDLYIPMVAGAYNGQKHSTTRIAPNKLVLFPYHKGIEILHYPVYLDEQEYQEEYDRVVANTRKIMMGKGENSNKEHQFKEGMMVYKKVLDTVGNSRKLQERFKGPYIIKKIDEVTGACELVLITARGREIKSRDKILAHVRQLKCSPQ
ncbi:Hypothetical protein SRAE_0000047000 [Strongyloides ratti]|uniref:Uncharacterized protein n=1 Tax=Strongyloides ratti TaxID=34506 RepID=A0A090L1J6_STRRB|nr:Hypothetical protein SRAE_0000047000 [Strongyloides ratti]CEF61344.1 Hypothetical protein SRAE_0000047000 [Strongyloides ratti]